MRADETLRTALEVIGVGASWSLVGSSTIEGVPPLTGKYLPARVLADQDGLVVRVGRVDDDGQPLLQADH